MKAVIDKAEFLKENDGKFGKMYTYKIEYNQKKAYYFSTKKDQTHFVAGKECEFEETEMKAGDGSIWYKVKPLGNKGYSPAGKAVKKEQSRYSGFAVSYVKDLIVAGKIEIKDWEAASKKIFQFMVDLDKTLEI